MGLNRLTILITGLIWCVMAQWSCAHADQGFTFAQIACMPAKSYLTVSTGFIWDIDPTGQKNYGSYLLTTPDVLESHPFTCKIKGRLLKIAADPKPVIGTAESCKSQLGGINLNISIDGRIVDTLRQVDCDGRRYQFAATVDSGFPAPDPSHPVFIDHCITDLQPGAYRKDVLEAASGTMQCVTRGISPGGPPEKSGTP